MRHPDFMFVLRTCLMLSFLAAGQSALAAACTTATPACTEWVVVGGGLTRNFVYRTYPLDTKNENITRALVMVHGGARDADNYFRHVLAAGFLAGALDDTVIVAPRFAANDGGSCRDPLAPDELNWSCQRGPDFWTAGGNAVNNARVASYDVVDEILRKLSRKSVFPNLKAIVFAGHSAGGAFVTRYSMANQIHDSLSVPITYVVANTASYAYLDSLRPTASAIPQGVAAGAPGYQAPLPAKQLAAFVPFADSGNCTAYDSWPYGLQRRTGYSGRLRDDQLQKQLVARQVTYILGQYDILPLFNFDESCPAAAQGPTRLARGIAFGRYVNEQFGAQHKAIVVAGCGHSARCMYTADTALPLIFPKP